MEKLFEVSWEVCNKVGGIYSVITSKANYIKRYFKEHYFVGPYLKNSDFKEMEAPDEFVSVFSALKEKNIRCYFGECIKTKTKTILVDFSDLLDYKNFIKRELWDEYKIDSLNSGWDFEEPIIWSYAVGILLEEISKKENGLIIGQFHEWLSGAGVLYIKKQNASVSCVFTTHATVLDRAMASSGKTFSEGMDSNFEAKRFGVFDKHLVEKQVANCCDVFTTVSKTTGESCKKILGRKPDVLVLNGLDLSNIRKLDYFNNNYRRKIKDFTKAIFLPYYSFDVDSSLFLYISGRYEFHAKGIDVFISALGNLNRKLKEEGIDKNIFVYFLIPSGVNEVNNQIKKNFEFFKGVRDGIYNNFDGINDLVFDSILFDKGVSFNDFFDFGRFQVGLEKNLNPPILTHSLSYNDYMILKMLSDEGLDNSLDNRIKVVFYPTYLNRDDGLLSLDYYEAIQGFDLGVFPSFYEPWGYTPAESTAFGVPCITTDMAGFGQFVFEKLNKRNYGGVDVIKREGKSYDEVVRQLVDKFYCYCLLSDEQKSINRLLAYSFSDQFSWDHLIENYLKAYDLAINRFNK